MANLEIQPWMMNLCAFISAVISGYFFSTRKILPALLVFIPNQWFDYMDGGVYRSRISLGMPVSQYRKLLHILSDKLSEIAIFLGIIIGKFTHWKLGLLAMTTSLVITLLGRWVYYKGLFDLKHSIFDRTDRFAILAIFCALGHFQLALILSSSMDIVGIIQRLCISIRNHLKKNSASMA